MRASLGILIAGSVALGGCAYGYGSGYGPYSSLSVGVGYGGGYGGYYDGGYGGYGYGDPYYGWYDNYYYPGTGYYVYDTYRRPHRWNSNQQRYWTQRRERVMSTQRTQGTSSRSAIRDNWTGFDHRTAPNSNRQRDETTNRTRPR